MKVTVKDKYLNVRVGAPSVNAPCYQYIAPGSQIDVDGQLYNGDLYNGINIWYKDAGGNYYWSGGVINGAKQISLIDTTASSLVKYDYNSLLPISAEVKNTKGAGITIAVIDTGCSDHASLQKVITGSYDVFQKKEGVHIDESLNGHGTFISGMIAARNINNSEIIGIAPMSNLISIKAVKDDEVYAQNILDGLNWILGLKDELLPQIINLSVDFDPENLTGDFISAFQMCGQKGITVIAAGQNEKEIYSSDIFYPARSGFPLGIGALSIENLSNNPLNEFISNEFISYVVPNLSFYSTTNYQNSYTNLNQCSISTAIVSAAYALFLSYKNQTGQITDLKTLVNNELKQLNVTNFDNSFKIFKK